MTLHSRASEGDLDGQHLSVNSLFSGEDLAVPKHRMPDGPMAPETAYEIVHDELMLDGNARLNLATFVTTHMEPQAEKLMAETFDKNMIDKDEYPQTAELEMRCVNMLSRLWNSPSTDEATGCSTTGSSEAAMLGGMALKRRWQQRRRAAGKSTERPNMVMGINVQICWEKFCNYWEVEPRYVPMEGDRFHLNGEEAVKLCEENTIGVVAILGSTFDGSYEPVQEISDALDDLQEPRRMRTLRMLELLTARVEKRLWITDAYFLSMPILTQSLMATARDGVDVRVMVPATNDIAWIGRASRAGYQQFLEAGVRIFEYGGPMIHAKTVVADGWWSKMSSTNLNFSSLFANWEIDLVAEDPGFAAQMEELFEEDLSNAREVHLVKTGRRQEARPERSVDTSNRGARRGVVGSGSGSASTLTRVGSAALQKGGAPLSTHEHALAAAASGTLLGVSLLGARFPRLVAWPLVTVGALFGGLGVIRAVRSTFSRRGPLRGPDGPDDLGALRDGGS